MKDVLGVDVGDCLDDLPDVSANVFFREARIFLKLLLKVLRRKHFTPSEQYSIKMYWKCSSSNQ